jgi:NADH:ubiquinone oxidoreductase subunit E
MRKHIFSPDALIESLHTLQEAFGHSGDLAVCCVAQSLRVSLSRIYGAATGHPDRNEVNEIER